ncbi:MAG: flagellar hook-length control protein FliK [Planctomycetaceae bacterium]|jgi:hypothetical protein|nr:flagellar hook-length control protein FliK [Planctomycetaceae bacterium]
MSVDNTTTYPVGSAVVSPAVVRSQELNALNSAFAAAFQASVAGKKINNTNELLLRETETTKQHENLAGKDTQNKRNDNNNAGTTRIDNQQLNKLALNRNEIRSSEIKTDYINQLDRREQIRNEYLNRLNKRSEQNKIEIIHEITKEQPQTKESPHQLSAISTNNQTQTITTANKNNIANNNDHIRFLNVSNHRAAVREMLGQGVLEIDRSPSEISVTIINSAVLASNETARPIANGQQTTFTIFTPTGRIEQVEYGGDENNNRQQNDENKNDEDKKEKNRNKKNNIEQLQSDNLSDDNFQASDIDSDMLSYLRQQKNSANEKTDLRSFVDTNNHFGNDAADIHADGNEDFDLSRLPEFIVTIISDTAKFTGQINTGSNTPNNENDLTDNNANDNVEEKTDDFEWMDVSRRHRLLLRIAAACRSMANRNNIFRIKLNLDTSGELFIRITKNKGNYSVSFTATNADVAEKLNNGLDSLIQSLANDNVKLDNIKIDIENSESENRQNNTE